MDGREAGTRGAKRSPAWRALVPITALAAGLLFATSAATARGTDLRGGRFSQVTELIDATADDVERHEQRAASLRADIARSQSDAAAGSTTVARETEQADALRGPAGLEAVTGPGITVSLDDAPRRDPGAAPASTNPDDLVVHQQDVQSTVNALWAGGAEAMTLMGERVISTTAIRCVGNTLLIAGRLVGPPFIIRAIGDTDGMQRALDVEPGVALFQQYVDRFGLGFEVSTQRTQRMPAYDGALVLPHVERS